MPAPPSTRAWVEIDLDAISHNLTTIQTFIGPGTGIFAVVKADAYGHGIEPVVRACDHWGVSGFAVIGLDEALRVRSESQRDVLVMGYLCDEEIEEAVRLGLILSLYDIEIAPIISTAAQRLRRTARVHLKVETGLNRLGMTVEDALSLIASPPEGVAIEAVFTHFSNSADREESQRQLARFKPVLEAAGSCAAHITAHMTKSHALAKLPESFLDHVRVGLAVYGFEEVIPGLVPALSAKTRVMQRKPLKTGEGVSYGHIFKADRDMEIAVIAMGYAEGLSLSMSEKIDVLINGHRARQLGRICMNLTIVDVTGIPAKRGDEVVILGRQGNESIDACEIAERTGLRQHEIVTRIGRSLPKMYVGGPAAKAVAAIQTTDPNRN